MAEASPKVIVIPAKPEAVKEHAAWHQLRVAAYCRVSTDDEEQLTSYEAQKTYYTDKIMKNPQWTMAGIFADEGITGTSARKRPEFLRMIRKCRQKKIDLVLVKSISRFARNTVDCLNYIRVLKSLGIAVIFEKENINTLESDSEMLITMMGAFAQAESESMSANIRWGKRQAMREGKASIHFNTFYGYERGEDGKPQIIEEQAEVVRGIFDRFLSGQSLRLIKEWLEGEGILTAVGKSEWTAGTIRNILTNEKYCGDVLMQKTFVADCIEKKTVRNIGQLPMYLIQDNHEGIISRETFHAAQAELTRRSAGKAPSKKQAPTGRSCYSAKYALSERLVCGECGSLHRRCVWTHHGQHRVVWRCISRIDYGTKYCKNSPTVDEKPLQEAILNAINSVMSSKKELVEQISDAMKMELIPITGETASVGDIDRLIAEQEQKFQEMFETVRNNQDFMKRAEEFKAINAELARLKARRTNLLEAQQRNSALSWRIDEAIDLLNTGASALAEWDESVVRQLVEEVRVVSKEKIIVTLSGGIKVEQTMEL